MINPFLIRERTLVDKTTDLVKKGAAEFLSRVLAVLNQVGDAGFVTYSVDLVCSGNVVTSGTDVFLCRSTVDQLDAIMRQTGTTFPTRKDDVRFLGKVGTVKTAVQKTLAKVTFSPMDLLPWALIGTVLWMLRPSRGLLNGLGPEGYPAEMARGAIYAQDCAEAQRRLDMAWKGLQQMENRGDPQFVHEANKVAKIAKQLRDNGCEVL